MADLTDLGVRCALCNAIVAAFGKSLPGNTNGSCTVAVKGNVLTVKAGSASQVATIDMKFAPTTGREHSNSFAVTRASDDPDLVQMTGSVPMTVEALARHVFATFMAALRA
jgi:hypothetical protein